MPFPHRRFLSFAPLHTFCVHLTKLGGFFVHLPLPVCRYVFLLLFRYRCIKIPTVFLARWSKEAFLEVSNADELFLPISIGSYCQICSLLFLSNGLQTKFGKAAVIWKHVVLFTSFHKNIGKPEFLELLPQVQFLSWCENGTRIWVHVMSSDLIYFDFRGDRFTRWKIIHEEVPNNFFFSLFLCDAMMKKYIRLTYGKPGNTGKRQGIIVQSIWMVWMVWIIRVTKIVLTNAICQRNSYSIPSLPNRKEVT